MEHCRGESGSALSVGYVPDSVNAEGSSVVDSQGRVEPLCARIKGVDCYSVGRRVPFLEVTYV